MKETTMIMVLAIITTLFIALIFAQGCSHWTPKQKALAVASIGASYADYRTTHHNLNLGHEHTELNPILGSRPSNGSLAAIGASYADYRTTHHNLNLGHEHTELNPILGSRPSNGSLAVYFISTELLILILADTFPEYRDEILTLKTSVNLGFAIHNYGETRSK